MGLWLEKITSQIVFEDHKLWQLGKTSKMEELGHRYAVMVTVEINICLYISIKRQYSKPTTESFHLLHERVCGRAKDSWTHLHKWISCARTLTKTQSFCFLYFVRCGGKLSYLRLALTLVLALLRLIYFSFLTHESSTVHITFKLIVQSYEWKKEEVCRTGKRQKSKRRSNPNKQDFKCSQSITVKLKEVTGLTDKWTISLSLIYDILRFIYVQLNYCFIEFVTVL